MDRIAVVGARRLTAEVVAGTRRLRRAAPGCGLIILGIAARVAAADRLMNRIAVVGAFTLRTRTDGAGRDDRGDRNCVSFHVRLLALLPFRPPAAVGMQASAR